MNSFIDNYTNTWLKNVKIKKKTCRVYREIIEAGSATTEKLNLQHEKVAELKGHLTECNSLLC